MVVKQNGSLPDTLWNERTNALYITEMIHADNKYNSKDLSSFLNKNILIVLFSFQFCLFANCQNDAPQNVFVKSSKPIIDNGTLTLKLDLTRGGAISYLSLSGKDRNIVNIYDEGRYIQQSYYSGKSVNRQDDGQSPSWSPWSWNPIQVGDAYRNRAEILDFQKSDHEMYVKCIPMQWDMNNHPAEAEMEQWTTLDGNVLKVRNRLTCHRTDTIYGEGTLNDQELPAVYPISALHNLYTYIGSSPFEGSDLSKLEVIKLSSGFWGRYDNISENWMAFVDDSGWGMAVYNSKCTKFLAGMAGVPGKEAHESSTSYIAPIKKERLYKNSVYEYEYYIVVGELSEIREKIVELHKKNKN